jgi:hypothetical protein
MSQAVNLRALRWAYEQEGLTVTSKAVLLTFAMHANGRGYSWPGVDHIASTWRMDRKTVRRGIQTLLAFRKIFRTKKRYGATGQVKVYRLPKITYESGGKSTRLQNNESGAKESLKSPISGGGFPPNKEQGNKGTKKHTHSAVFSANGLTEEQKQIVSHYNETFVPEGWLPVNKITPAVRNVLDNCTGEQFDALADTVATHRDNWPRTRTFWALFSHTNRKPRLASKSNKDLRSLRYELIEERKGKLNDARRAETKKQLLEIKGIFKTRGIEYPASI